MYLIRKSEWVRRIIMGIIREVFGHDSHGATVYSYTVTNDHGTRIRLIVRDLLCI